MSDIYYPLGINNINLKPIYPLQLDKLPIYYPGLDPLTLQQIAMTNNNQQLLNQQQQQTSSTATLPSSLFTPYVNVFSYQDISNDKELLSKMIIFYYDKIKHWLQSGDYSDLFDLFEVKNGKVVRAKSISGKKHSDSDSEKIYSHIKNILSKKLIYKILKRFTEKMNVRWVDLDKYTYKSKVKYYIMMKLVRFIERNEE